MLALDHENPAVEIIVSDNERFAVAETLVGQASRIPEETNPRVHHNTNGSSPAESFSPSRARTAAE